MSTAPSPGLFMTPDVEPSRELRSEAPSAQPAALTVEPSAKRVKLEDDAGENVASGSRASSGARASNAPSPFVIDLTEDKYFVGGGYGFLTKPEIKKEFERLRDKYAELFLFASQRADPAKKMHGTLEDTYRASERSGLVKILERDQQDWGKQLVNAMKALTKELGDLENAEIKLDREAYRGVVEAAYAECEAQCRAKLERAQAELEKRQDIIGKMKILKEAVNKTPV